MANDREKLKNKPFDINQLSEFGMTKQLFLS